MALEQAMRELLAHEALWDELRCPRVITGTEGRALRDRRVILAGPWMGELGVSLIRWIPYLRALHRDDPEAYLIAGGYAYCARPYLDFCDEYWVLPDEIRACFLNRDTSFNYGVFHGMCGNSRYAEHENSKGWPLSTDVHTRIAEAWLQAAAARGPTPSRMVADMGEEREFALLSSSPAARDRARALFARAKLNVDNGCVLFLPRLRQLQGKLRSWPTAVYLNAISALAHELPVPVVVLGSREHEGDLTEIGQISPRVIDTMGEGFDVQLAFWEVGSAGIGPPSGGLVPGYLTKTPLVHWYKPGLFPMRHGQPWNVSCEPDYAVFGIRSEWIEIGEDGAGIAEMARIAQRGMVAKSPSPTPGT